jgi:regulation of enolase protein 1 (concanavalin A-like superfamily)
LVPDPLGFLDKAEWHAEPPFWHRSDGVLELETGDGTDFWQDTFYGFRRDDGHFFGASVSGDFTAVVTFDADYHVLYDQAGMMLRADARTWLKTGVEFSDDVTNFSVVVTREGRSDWSVVGVPRVTGPQKVRLTRIAGAVIVHYLGAGGNWHLLRLADFSAPPALRLGPMACSPERAGFRARFTGFHVGPAMDAPLHAS